MYHQALRWFGYSAADFPFSVQMDEGSVFDLMTDLLRSRSGGNVVLSLASSPCQAQALLDLIENVSFTVVMTYDTKNSPAYQLLQTTVTQRSTQSLPTTEPTGVGQSTRNPNLQIMPARTYMRRMSIKLAEASDQLPSSLFYTNVALLEPHALKGGAFADIHRAKHSDSDALVAVKRLRIFLYASERDRPKMTKV